MPNTQSNPEKEQTRGITLPDFKLHYKATGIKVWGWHRHIDQWKRIEHLELTTHPNKYLIREQGTPSAGRIVFNK